MADMAETNWDENIKARLARPPKERRSSEPAVRNLSARPS